MSYVGMATNIVGGIMQSVAASQENAAMQDAFNQELQQQLGLSGQAFGQFMSGLPSQGSEAANKAINTGASKAQGLYGQVGSMPLLANGGDSDPRAATDQAALSQEGVARSKLSGMGDWKLNNLINNIKTSDAINRINFRSQGLNQVFPYKMYAAQHSQDELDFWGKAIQSLGSGGSGTAMNSSPPPQSPQSSLTNQQYAALGQGYGPVNSSFAQGLYMPTNVGSGLGNTTQLLPATGY